METETKPHIQTTETESPDPRNAWQRPTLTHIEIKQTMSGSGPTSDGPAQSILT
jgi:hypothetical protein